MLSSTLEPYLLAVYEFVNKGEELKISRISKSLDVPLKKTIQALQRMHFQKYIIYLPYQPISITEKGLEMAKYLMARNAVIDEFLEIFQVEENKALEKEVLQQYLSHEALEAMEKFILFVRQYPEVIARYKIFSKRKLKTRLLESLPEDEKL